MTMRRRVLALIAGRSTAQNLALPRNSTLHTRFVYL